MPKNKQREPSQIAIEIIFSQSITSHHSFSKACTISHCLIVSNHRRSITTPHDSFLIAFKTKAKFGSSTTFNLWLCFMVQTWKAFIALIHNQKGKHRFQWRARQIWNSALSSCFGFHSNQCSHKCCSISVMDLVVVKMGILVIVERESEIVQMREKRESSKNKCFFNF